MPFKRMKLFGQSKCTFENVYLPLKYIIFCTYTILYYIPLSERKDRRNKSRVIVPRPVSLKSLSDKIIIIYYIVRPCIYIIIIVI